MAEITVAPRLFATNEPLESPPIQCDGTINGARIVWNMADADRLDPAYRSECVFEVSPNGIDQWERFGGAAVFGRPRPCF